MTRRDLTPQSTLLTAGDPDPVGIRNGDAQSPFFMFCDHAGNAVPKALDHLGLSTAELNRHIGIDIGILGVSERLSDLLSAPLIFQRYSRLVIECNRVLSAPDLIALESDGTVVPGNAHLTSEDRERRLDEIVNPYRREVLALLEQRAALGQPTVILSMHSFTPMLRSKPQARPWQVCMCVAHDSRFTQHLLPLLDAENLTVGRNEPYGIDPTLEYSVPTYAEARGLPYAEFEIRQDLITDAAGQVEWAERLARVIPEAYRSFSASA